MTEEQKRKKSLSIKRLSLYVLLILIAVASGIEACSSKNSRPAVKMQQSIFDAKPALPASTRVAMIQSTRKEAADITEAEVRMMVREAVKLTGGLNGIVNNGDTVVLKPNFMAANDMSGSFFGVLMMMSSDDPHPKDSLLEPTVNGIATDYRVTKAVAELVRELNPNGKILLMEASGAGFTDKKMELLGYNHESIPFIDEFISMDETGRGYESGNMDDLVAVDLGEKRLYQDDEGLKHTGGFYYFNKTYYNADVIISIPVLKNHQMASVTGSIKNVAIGASPPGIYGPPDGSPSRMAIDHDWEPLNNFIHDHYMARPVDFVVTDGLQAIEHGPLAMGADSLKEVQMNMRLILAGKDALAVDTVHALVTGVDPEQVDYFKALAKDNIGIMDPARINVVGNVRVDDVRKPFKFPGFPYTMMNPEPRKRIYRDFEKPVVEIGNVKLKGKTITADLNSDKSLVKLEYYIDGTLAETKQVNAGDIELTFENNALTDGGSLEIIAYDKFMNSGIARIALK